MSFLSVGSMNNYDATKNVQGALGTTYGEDAVNPSYFRTDYVPINLGLSGDGVVVKVSGYTLPSTPYYFIYPEKGVSGTRVLNTSYQRTILDGLITDTFTVSGNFKYFRTLTFSPTGGDYSVGMQIITNGYPNSEILKNYELDKRYILNSDLNVSVSAAGSIYDGVAIVGGLTSAGADASDPAYDRTNYLSLNSGEDAAGVSVVVIYGLPAVYSKSYIFLYTGMGVAGVAVGSSATFNSDTGAFEFTIPSGGFKYLRFNNRSPSWSLTGPVSVSSGEDSAVINNVDLGQIFYERKGDMTDPITVENATAIITPIVSSEVTAQITEEIDPIIAAEVTAQMSSEIGTIVATEVSSQLVEQANQKFDRPTNGVVNFTTLVNVNFADTSSDTLSVQDTNTELVDDALLLLPTNYTPGGSPIRLVINCHGAGTTITSSSTTLTNPVPNLLKLGYAVLDCNGIPKSLSGDARFALWKSYSAAVLFKSI